MYVIDDVKALRTAVSEYRDEMMGYGDTLLNAASICEDAIGSDPNAQRHIARLYEALNKLAEAVDYTNDLISALDTDIAMAEDTLIDD